MKKKFNKKKIAISVTSVTLVLATLIALVPYALASTDRSLEYIELLKQNRSFKILEIAPSESDGTMGYYVKDSEPIANWKERAAMLTSPAARESYVNNDVNTKLLNQGVMSREANKAPLYLEDMYDEFYPWEIKNTEGYNILNLDDDETVKVKGTMKETEAGQGDYVSNDTYVPVDNYFKNYFDFTSWRTTLGETLREKLGASYDVDKFSNTKILAVNKNNKTMTVFGSTEINWTQEYAIDNSSVLYDLASVYENPEYYSIEMEENKDNSGHYLGGAFILSVDAKVFNGKGQVTVVPYDENGNIVKYRPNISRQYWFRQETVGTGHYEYKFNVPNNTNIKYLQVKFDVDNIKAAATFSNVSIYRYSKDYFDMNAWKSNSSAATNNNGVITVSAPINESQIVGGKPIYSRAKLRDNESYFACDPNTFYTLTYHAELMPGGGKTKAYVIGYDKDGNLIGTDFISADKWSKSISGTYSVDFFSKNATALVVVFNITGAQKAYYSNVSIVKALDFAKEDATATHRQIIDYFNNGNVGFDYGSNIFNFHEWFNTASYSKAPGSDVSSSVIADESNGIITVTNRGATATSDIFKATDNMYYIPVDDSSEYRLTYTSNSSSTVPHKVTIVYCDETKTTISKDEKLITPTVAGPDEYKINFTTLPNCRWLQISFGNTENNQKNIFSSINLNKKETPKVYYYNVAFTKIPTVADIGALPEGTPIYTPKYTNVGEAGTFTDLTAGEKYYYFDEYNDQYVETTDFATLPSKTAIYVFSGIYDFAGHVGDKDVSFNILKEYYTGEINYNGYTLVENPTEKIGMGTAYFIKDEATGKYITDGIRNESTVFDPAKEYYILTSVIKEAEDKEHPYWVIAEAFEPADDHTALFTRKSEGYRYVGEGEGNYKFTLDPNGKEEQIISTPLVYYKGGIINNEWFKKGVLNCNEEEMNIVAVSVTTVSPTYLNSLDEEELVYFLQGYELFVISYGGVEGTARYQEDISQQVRTAIFKEALDTWETKGGTGEEVTTAQYKIPVMIDNRVCKMESERNANNEKFVHLPALANDLCIDFVTDGAEIVGGVNRYIYKFDASDVKFNTKSIVNEAFLEKLRASYSSTVSPYYPVYKEIVYENFIRSANKDKYSQLDTTVSEATAIRYILNFRGQRIQRYKEKIRVLEIQPYTEKSELLNLDGTLKTEVKQWFSPTGDLTYVNENNEVQEIDIEVTTMAMGELAAKNGSIVENNDVIYFGSSLTNMDLVGDRATKGLKNDDGGKVVPDYRDSNLDGKYYTSTGDLVETGQKGLKRAPLAGLVGGDYKALRDIKIDFGIFGEWKIGEDIIKGSALDLWYIDASDCELRKSGNDMTVNIMEQIKAFANSGRPVIFSDNLVENEFVGEFSVDIRYEIAGWDEKDDLPIIRFVADLNTDGNTLPEGVQPEFTWFCQTSTLSFTDKNGKRSTVKNEDIDGDGVNEGIYEFVFKDGDSLRGLGDYYAEANFKFAKSKYKGLREITNLCSETVNLDYENIEYILEFTSPMKHNLETVEAVFKLKGEGYMPSLISNGGRNHIFEFVWKSRSLMGTYGRIHTKEVTFEPDPFDPTSSYDPLTTREIKTTATFDEQRYAYQLSLYVDETNEDRPTLRINYATSSDTKDEGYIRYYNFTPKGDGTHKTTADGIALNEDAFDNSSYTYECVKEIFANTQNVFSEMMLNMNTNLERNNLIRYSNLSAPEIVMIEEPICYPNSLEENAIEFKFKILNYTDDTIATTRYRYEFYVDNNSDSKFSANELTDASVYGSGSTSVTGSLKASTEEKLNEYKFYKKFPASTAGVVPWKFVIIKEGDKTTEATTHNSITKYSYIKPETPANVSAVQILPANWSPHYVRAYSTDEEYNKMYSDIYTGSVFLCDAFVDSALTGKGDTKGKETHLPLTRYINYKIVGVSELDPEPTTDGSGSSSEPTTDGSGSSSEPTTDGSGSSSEPTTDGSGSSSEPTTNGSGSTSEPTTNGSGSSSEPTTDGSGSSSEPTTNARDPIVTGEKNAKYSEDYAKIQGNYKGKTIVPESVDFTVGTDWTLKVSFKTVAQINEVPLDQLYNDLNMFDMIILGFGDQYGRHPQEGETGIGSIYTYEGFQQNPVRVLERLIGEGKATLFCHDTAFFSNNFVSYIANDVANWVSEGIQKIKDFFEDLFGLGDGGVEVKLHSSRVKQGYYINIGLRDNLGLDRYGVTKNIKERIVSQYKTNSYYELYLENKHLRDGHDYSTIYRDGKKTEVEAVQNLSNQFTSKMYWNKGDTMTVKQRTQEFLDGFYDVAYVPGSARTKVDVFFQGYTDFTIEKFRSDDGIDELPPAMTNRITQVNTGQITSYPYDINVPRTLTNDRKEYGTLDIMPTHDQVYQVSLQTDDIGNGTTVWYALANTDTKYQNNYNSFRNNATNGYFIYTHNNVTYTGSGHSNNFTVTEAKLFINTIVAAYRIVSDKPAVNYVTPDGQSVIAYQTLTSGLEGKSVKVENDNIYFRLKDTSVDSELVKSLSVKFFIPTTPVKDKNNNIVGYDFSKPIVEGGKTIGYDFTKETAVYEMKLDPNGKPLKGNIVYSFEIANAKDDAIRKRLEDTSVNETLLYAVPYSTLTGMAGGSTTVEGDYAVLNLRELNLRSLV